MEILKRAQGDRGDALLSSGLAREEVKLFIAELSAYSEILKGNFRLFEEMLRGYRGE